MASAAGMIARLAPPPDPVTDEYVRLAASAELMAGEYLWDTGGYLRRSSTLDKTTEYTEGIEAQVINVMGSYARTTSRSGASRTIEVLSTHEPPDNTLPTP